MLSPSPNPTLRDMLKDLCDRGSLLDAVGRGTLQWLPSESFVQDLDNIDVSSKPMTPQPNVPACLATALEVGALPDAVPAGLVHG